MKRFLLVGIIVAGIGISIAIIQAASLLPSSSTTLQKTTTTTPTSTTTKLPTTPTTTKIDISKTQTPTKDTKTPSITIPLDKLKSTANPQSTLQDLSKTPTDTQKQDANTASSKTLKTLTPAINTVPKDNTDILKPIDIPKPTINIPLEKITPLSPETKPSIVLPLKENTDPVQKLKNVTPEFLLTPPPKDSVSLPENILLTPKLPENTIILEKITSKENAGSEITLPLMSALFKDVSESNSSYQAIKDIVDLMTKHGNYALPRSKKFRPRNKVRPGFAAQIAVSLAGESCGAGKGGANKQRTCLVKALELGLLEKSASGDKPMLRGDFYDLVLHAMKIPAVEPADGLFCTDVDASDTYANIIATAKRYGIARRYTKKGEGGYCLPNTPLTKADAAVIASKALAAK